MSGGGYVKRVRALHQRKFREAEGLFLVQGRKMVGELLASSFEVLEVHATEEAAHGLDHGKVIVSPAHDLERMGTFTQGNEVVAVVRKPQAAQVLLPRQEGFALAVDGVADPGNLGTLVRIADWFGAQQLWCSPESVELWNPKCVQASMGSLFRVPVVYAPLPTALHYASEGHVHVYKAEANGTDVFHVQLQRPAVLVLGSESHGISKAVQEGPGTSIAIPSFGGAESLNVSMAAAALCTELARQGTLR